MVKLASENSREFYFPHLKICIKVTIAKGDSTRVVVAMPEEFGSKDFFPQPRSIGAAGSQLPEERPKWRHELCNRLHVAGLCLEMLKSRACTEIEDNNELEMILKLAIESLSELEELRGAE